MASNFAPLHWDAPRVMLRLMVLVGLTVAPCCHRGSSAGPELKKLVGGAAHGATSSGVELAMVTERAFARMHLQAQ